MNSIYDVLEDYANTILMISDDYNKIVDEKLKQQNDEKLSQFRFMMKVLQLYAKDIQSEIESIKNEGSKTELVQEVF